MTVVDSCGWLAYFSDDPRGEAYSQHVTGPGLIVPTIVIYEVIKVLRRDMSLGAAAIAVARLRQATVVPLDEALALHAADISLERRLPAADAVIYATALLHDALLVTSDDHFQGLPGVEYIPRPQPAQDTAPPATNS